MDIKGVIVFAAVIGCSTINAVEVGVVTNRVFVKNSASVKSCVAHDYSNDTIISNTVLPQKEMVLARNLADIFIRKIALRDYSRPKIQKDASGQRYVLAHDKSIMFPIAMPDDFWILGMPYDNLQLMTVPYVVSNENLEGAMKGVLCEYRSDGVFKFALYVNLNTLSVSPDFYEGTTCKIIVSRLGRYPFLKEGDVGSQEEFVRKTTVLQKTSPVR